MAMLTDREVLSAMRDRGPLMTGDVANRVRAMYKHHGAGALCTARVLYRLKKLERLGIVRRIKSPYARQICWIYKEPDCTVGGIRGHGLACGSVLVGGKKCGHNGPCEHQRFAEDR